MATIIAKQEIGLNQNPVARKMNPATDTLQRAESVEVAVAIQRVPKAAAAEMVAKAKAPRTTNVTTRALRLARIVQSPEVIRRGVHTNLRFLTTEAGYHAETRLTPSTRLQEKPTLVINSEKKANAKMPTSVLIYMAQRTHEISHSSGVTKSHQLTVDHPLSMLGNTERGIVQVLITVMAPVRGDDSSRLSQRWRRIQSITIPLVAVVVMNACYNPPVTQFCQLNKACLMKSGVTQLD